MNRKKSLYYLALATACLAILVACAKAPYTGRNQFIVISSEQELALGRSAARDVLEKEKQDTTSPQAKMVTRVGERIAAVADQPDFKWEFHTIANDEVPNAFCLPGGKVFVYSGLFKYAKTEAELAAVIGHEVGHAIARHGAERVSTSLAVQVGSTAAMIAIGEDLSPAMQQVTAVAFGVGANVGILLPFSRTQEYESDRIGLILMAKAGYDPHAALSFWERFAQQPGQKPPEFLSTHPASENRIAEIKQLIPDAMKHYKPKS